MVKSVDGPFGEEAVTVAKAPVMVVQSWPMPAVQGRHAAGVARA
jgi:hypothetical protein